MTIKKGDTVRLIQPEIRGQVLTRQVNKATDGLEALVEYADANGDTHRKWFDVDALEAIEPPADPLVTEVMGDAA